MKGLIVILLVAVALSSCQKVGVNPVSSTTSTNTTVNSATTAAATTDTATLLHTVTVNAKNQVAKTAITDSTLNITYNEDVALLVSAKGYAQCYAMHLTEDFTGSILSKFNFTSSSQTGVSTYNYIENNLNNVDFKTISDTVVNNTAMKKVRVQRTINFTKRFGTPALAVAAQKVALGLTEQVKFTSYIYYDKNYPSTTGAAKINYY